METKKIDSVFKSRFGIKTLIDYTHDIVIDPNCATHYTKAWEKFLKKMPPPILNARYRRFEAFCQRITKLQDDLPYADKVSILYINKHMGYGVFAKQDIPPYAILNHYAGVLKKDKMIPLENDSAFTFNEFPKFSIDGRQAGNWTRFMNHGKEKDLSTNVIAWEHYSKYGPRIIFTAGKRGIKKGDQLLYSYGDSYWEEGELT